MARASFSLIPRFVTMMGFGLLPLSVHALSPAMPYVLRLGTVISEGEPCFYAEKATDFLTTSSKKNPVLENVSIAMQGTEILQQQTQKMELSASPQACVRLSQLFPKEIVQLIHPGTMYHIRFDVAYESDRTAAVAAYQNSPSSPPVLPIVYTDFHGAFCTVKKDGGIQLTQKDCGSSSFGYAAETAIKSTSKQRW